MSFVRKKNLNYFLSFQYLILSFFCVNHHSLSPTNNTRYFSFCYTKNAYIRPMSFVHLIWLTICHVARLKYVSTVVSEKVWTTLTKIIKKRLFSTETKKDAFFMIEWRRNFFLRVREPISLFFTTNKEEKKEWFFFSSSREKNLSFPFPDGVSWMRTEYSRVKNNNT